MHWHVRTVRRLTWFGQATRRENGHPSLASLILDLNGDRGRERPCKNWTEVPKKDVATRQVTPVLPAEWRKSTRRTPFNQGKGHSKVSIGAQVHFMREYLLGKWDTKFTMGNTTQMWKKRQKKTLINIWEVILRPTADSKIGRIKLGEESIHLNRKKISNLSNW